jgi:hypothetical protein
MFLDFPKPKRTAWGTVGAQKAKNPFAATNAVLAFGTSRFIHRLETP